MNLLPVLLILMFASMLGLVALTFRMAGKPLLSAPFCTITFFSALVSYTLYSATGSAPELAHYELEKTIQALGGMDAIVRAIEKRVAEHPEDKQGREILNKIKKNP